MLRWARSGNRSGAKRGIHGSRGREKHDTYRYLAPKSPRTEKPPDCVRGTRPRSGRAFEACSSGRTGGHALAETAETILSLPKYGGTASAKQWHTTIRKLHAQAVESHEQSGQHGQSSVKPRPAGFPGRVVSSGRFKYPCRLRARRDGRPRSSAKSAVTLPRRNRP